MKTRRGSNLWGGGNQNMVHQYRPGDLVYSVLAADNSFLGIVRDVDPRINKVLVAWGGGAPTQHDPEEIMFYVSRQDINLNERVAESESVKVASVRRFGRRARQASLDGME